MARLEVKATVLTLIASVAAMFTAVPAHALPPYVDNPPPNVITNEDQAVTVQSLAGVFNDPDPLHQFLLDLTVISISHPAIDNAWMTTNTLNISLLPDQFGTGVVRVQAEDPVGETATVDVTVIVNEINDAPVVVGAVTDVNVTEDAANENRDFSTVFSDIDHPLPGDPIAPFVFNNSNTGLFNSAAFAGNTLQLDFADNANGSAVLTIRTTDRGGLSADYVLNVNVSADNDAPFVASAPAGMVTDEDVNPTRNVSGVFDDVDIPEGDTLTLSVVSWSHPAVAGAGVSVTNVLGVSLIPDAFGTGTITIQAEDAAGATETVDINLVVNEVNDAPTVAGAVSNVNVLEDAANEVVDLSGLFADVDEPNPGDPLALSVAANTNPALFSGSPSIGGTNLTLDFADNINGSATLTLEATDRMGESVTYDLDVTVGAVNDAPFVSGVVPNLATDEDAPDSFSLAGLFDDIDITTNGDTLGYSVTTIANPAIATATMSGDVLGIVPAPDQFGTGTVTVRATDSGGLWVEATIPVEINSVNDLPFVAAAPANPTYNEDSPPVSIDVSGVFSDADIATGDTLTVTAAAVSGFDTVFSSVNVSAGDMLDLSFAADMNGEGRVLLTAEDDDGETATHEMTVTVNAVNDAPTVVGSIADVTLTEDQSSDTRTITAFDDVDIVTNSDVLTYSVLANTNPGLANITFVGDQMTITPMPDQFGSADVDVMVTDLAGATAGPVRFTLTLTIDPDPVTGVDDDLSAAGVTDWEEDEGTLVFSVLDNDIIPDGGGTVTGVSDAGQHFVVDGNGDTQVLNNGVVDFDATTVSFEPAEHFWGDVTITYYFRDVDGSTGEADIIFYIDPVNDQPEAVNLHEYTTFANADLVVAPEQGLLRGAYDVDPARVDINGSPLVTEPLTIVFNTFPDPLDGSLIATGTDGSFTFQPVTDFTGIVTFTYSVFDNQVLSGSGNVSIEVFPLPDPGDPPAPGEVAVNFNLANTPLEQSASVEPNVLVTMDDSGSMDWNFSMNMNDLQGRFVVTNASIANSSVRTRTFSYLWDLPTNTYGTNSSCCGLILPDEASLAAGNDYAVWRGRSAAFNAIYYNPEVQYEPWAGLDAANNEFDDADPTAIRLDPTSTAQLFDITVNHSYSARRVPRWQTSGGDQTINVTGYFIPKYYQADGTLIEIRPANGPFPGGPEREDCADPTACTYDEEIQNFANWFEFYRSRGHVAKAAVGNVIVDLQDIRVGYETINRNEFENIAEMNEYYWEGEKEELLDAVYSVPNVGGTPLRRALDDAGRVLNCTRGSGRTCPALPAPEGVCQQNYALLFTDGYWNQNPSLTGNFDQDGTGVWDGGRYADTFTSTVADVAMYYYENDMFTGVDDGVPVTSADIAGAPDGTFSSGTSTMHQHMKTYTIAFGVEGSIDPDTAFATPVGDAIAWLNPGTNEAGRIDDMLHAALNGRGRFLDAGNPQELQSAIETAFLEFTQAASSTSAAAFNSTSLREGTLLYRGFYDLRNRTGEMTATEVSTTGVLAATPTWTAAELLDPTHPDGLAPSERTIVSFDPATNAGIEFQYADLTTDQQTTLSANQHAYMRGVRTQEEPAGSLRDRLDTEGLLGDIVNSSPVFVGTARATNRDQAPYPTDDLYSDFVDDVKDRTAVVYVGANDGMMHGFNATTGEELYAYMPNLVIDATARFNNKVDNFTSTFYLHDYYVDLTPRLNDVYMRPSSGASKRWLTTLVGGLGAGGKGFFALDVTDPDTMYASESAATASVLWEFSEEDDTYPVDSNGDPIGGSVGAITDPDGQPVKDLGYSLSLPSIVMSNAQDLDGEKEWVAVFGNGPNSTAGIATLFVLFMDKGADGWGSSDFVKITTDFGVPLAGEELEGYPNGLGSPTAVDEDLNGTTDYVYAGDRLGNLWRFDVSSSNTSNWKAVRIFSATYDDGGTDMLQPILSRPLVTKHPDKPGFLVTVGTGSFVTEEDGENTDIQSIYTIWDNPAIASPPTANSDTKDLRLVEQEISNVVDDTGAVTLTRRIVTSNAVEYESETATPGTYGWYIDLDIERATTTIGGDPNPDTAGNAPPGAQYPGEKAIRRWLFRDGVIITTTVLPATDETSCFGARPGAILVLDGLTGGDPVDPIIDFNTDTYVDEDDLVSVNGQTYSGGLLFDYSALDGALVDLSTLGGEGDTDFLFVSGGNDTVSYRIRDLADIKTGRLSWIQLEAN